jgi:hypothetical protein
MATDLLWHTIYTIDLYRNREFVVVLNISVVIKAIGNTMSMIATMILQ